jgi:hypothetical protein
VAVCLTVSKGWEFAPVQIAGSEADPNVRSLLKVEKEVSFGRIELSTTVKLIDAGITVYEDFIPLLLNISIPSPTVLMNTTLLKRLVRQNPACSRRVNATEEQIIRKALLMETRNASHIDQVSLALAAIDSKKIIQANCLTMNVTMRMMDGLHEFLSSEEKNTQEFDARRNRSARAPEDSISEDFGDFFSWCCSVVTKKSLTALQSNERETHKYMDQIKELADTDHVGLIGQGKKINDLGAKIDNYTLHNTQEVTELYGELQGLTAEEMNLNTLFVQGLATLTELIARNTVNDAWKAAEILCLLDMYPHTIADMDMLEEQLNKVSVELRKVNKEIVYPANKWRLLAEMPLTKCKLTKNSAELLIKVPIKHKENQYLARKLVAYPFAASNGSVCNIPLEQHLFAKGPEGLTRLDEQEHLCGKGLCQARRMDFFRGNFKACYEAMFQESSSEEILSKCPVRCQPMNLPHVVKVDHNLFSVITNERLNVLCRGTREIEPVLPRAYGSQMVRLGCKCKLVLAASGIEVVEEQVPCLEGQKTQVNSHFPIFLANMDKLGHLAHNPEREEGVSLIESHETLEEGKLAAFDIHYQELNLSALERETLVGEPPILKQWIPPYVGIDWLALISIGMMTWAYVILLRRIKVLEHRMTRVERTVIQETGAGHHHFPTMTFAEVKRLERERAARMRPRGISPATHMFNQVFRRRQQQMGVETPAETERDMFDNWEQEMAFTGPERSGEQPEQRVRFDVTSGSVRRETVRKEAEQRQMMGRVPMARKSSQEDKDDEEKEKDLADWIKKGRVELQTHKQLLENHQRRVMDRERERRMAQAQEEGAEGAGGGGARPKLGKNNWKNATKEDKHEKESLLGQGRMIVMEAKAHGGGVTKPPKLNLRTSPEKGDTPPTTPQRTTSRGLESGGEGASAMPEDRREPMVRLIGVGDRRELPPVPVRGGAGLGDEEEEIYNVPRT